MDIIEKARALAKDLAGEDCVVRYNMARQASDEDKKLQELIGRFNLRRIELNNQIGKKDEEKNAERIGELDREIKSIYEEVMANENMAAYNTAKQEVDRLMSFVNGILTAGVNGEDPDAVEESSCSGDCSGCSGCH